MLKIKRLTETAKLPKRTMDSAGYDLYSDEKVTIKPGSRVMVSTGIAVEFPHGFVGRICDRSGMASRGLHVMAGVIDSNYRGEWKIIIFNTSNLPCTIEAQSRVAQVLFYEVADWFVDEVDELSKTVRGASGFGSTGDK